MPLIHYFRPLFGCPYLFPQSLSFLWVFLFGCFPLTLLPVFFFLPDLQCSGITFSYPDSYFSPRKITTCAPSRIDFPSVLPHQSSLPYPHLALHLLGFLLCQTAFFHLIIAISCEPTMLKSCQVAWYFFFFDHAFFIIQCFASLFFSFTFCFYNAAYHVLLTGCLPNCRN